MKQIDGIVRIGPWMAIPEVLRSFGLDPADVFDEARIDPDLFLDGDNTTRTVGVESAGGGGAGSSRRCDNAVDFRPSDRSWR